MMGLSNIQNWAVSPPGGAAFLVGVELAILGINAGVDLIEEAAVVISELDAGIAFQAPVAIQVDAQPVWSSSPAG